MNTDRFVLVAKDEMLQPKILRRKTILNDLENTQIKQLIEEPFFVPENKPLSELFTEIRNGQATSEIVAIDEHGSVVGAMSQRTVLEMVFNEPLLRGKEAQAQFSRIGDSYLLQGSLTLSEFNEIFDAEFRSKYSTTIAGFLTEIFGEIPNAGKSIDIGGFRFRIIHSTIRRIERIAVKRIEA